MRPISLDQLTVAPVRPPELIEIAAAVDCRMVYAIAGSLPGAGIVYDLMTEPALVRETRRRAEDLGVEIRHLASVRLHPRFELSFARRLMEIGAQLGTRNLVVVGYDPDRKRAEECFLQVCELAWEYGLGIVVEPVSYSEIKTLKDGAAFVALTKTGGVGLSVDVLHLYRSGGKAADLASIDPGLIRYAQLCDGPLVLPREGWFEEARSQRAIPGEGDLPLMDFLRALPKDIPVGVEVPLANLAGTGLGPLQRAKLAVDATRRLLELAA